MSHNVIHNVQKQKEKFRNAFKKWKKKNQKNKKKNKETRTKHKHKFLSACIIKVETSLRLIHIQTTIFDSSPKPIWYNWGGLSFLRKGAPNFPKVSVNKTATPYFGSKNFMTPSITDTPYPLNRLKLYWNQSFLSKINTLSVVILWLPKLSKNLWPPYFSLKKIWPPVYLGPPIQKKKITPLYNFLTLFYLSKEPQNSDLKQVCQKSRFI